MGPSNALKMVKEHSDIEEIVAAIKSNKRFALPDDWPYADAKELFLNPEVLPPDDPTIEAIAWNAPDTEGLVQFLVTEKGFSEDRVRAGAARLTKNLKSAQQSRLEGFFKPMERSKEEQEKLKRKNMEKVEERKAKKKQAEKEKKEAKSKPRGTA
jgi:flap endonuclease-1